MMSEPFLYHVDSKLLKRIYSALATARDNAFECLNAHSNSIKGNPSKYENFRTRILKRDADVATALIKELTDKYGQFGK